MDYNEEKFKQHIKEIVAISDIDSDRPLSLDELKELALSMGLSDKEWDKLQVEADNHLKVAERHLNARNYVDAIQAADKATAINPYIKDGNSILAQAYLMQWIDDNDSEKRNKAEFYARKEIKVDPADKRAINVLSTVQNKKRIAGEGDKIKKYIFIGVGIILFFIIVGFFTMSPGNSGTLNQLIQAEENVNAKWGDLQAVTDRRNHLIPDLLNSLSQKKPELNKSIKNLQKQLKKAKGDNKFDLENQLADKITEAKLVVRGNDQFKNSLIIEIEGAENRISHYRKNYNQAVKEYNILVKTNQADFPQFETKSYFE